FAVPARSRLTVFGLLAMMLLWAPVGGLVELGNWTAVSALALPLSLLLAYRGRWDAAALVLGVSVAIKPLLVPVILLFIMARQWRAAAWALTVPAALCAGAVCLMRDPSAFLTRTLPFLLKGGDAVMKPYDCSLPAVLPRLGVPMAAAAAAGAAAAAAGVAFAWLRWRRSDPGPLRIAETAAMLMLATYLVSRPSFSHYLVVVVPLLLASTSLEGSITRISWFWVALIPQVPGFAFPYLDDLGRRAFKDMGTLLILALVVAAKCARRTWAGNAVAPAVRKGAPRRGHAGN
ncbi:glycosyltransferase 87 family protein, partial [Streptomyces sp. 1222.5]|uniref:glycosyltransferase 87 family protein n=1 Tax=Streptomyces sp. 1222.5 TaxID=1881026 RepID=UPI003D746F4D